MGTDEAKWEEERQGYGWKDEEGKQEWKVGGRAEDTVMMKPVIRPLHPRNIQKKRSRTISHNEKDSPVR